MSLAKVRIKLGQIEVDYEGDSTFLNNDLLALVAELHKLVPFVIPSASSSGGPSASDKPNGPAQPLTTKSIATKLNAKSASDLAEAAIAHLAIFKEMDKFRRSDINDAMKSATGIYKPNMTSNLSATIKTLLNQNKIVETSAEMYALTPETESELRGRLGIG